MREFASSNPSPMFCFNELKDIHQVFLEMEPTDNTTFVAASLSNVPPLRTREPTDMKREVDSLRSEIKSLISSHNELASLVKENMVHKSECVVADGADVKVNEVIPHVSSDNVTSYANREEVQSEHNISVDDSADSEEDDTASEDSSTDDEGEEIPCGQRSAVDPENRYPTASAKDGPWYRSRTYVNSKHEQGHKDRNKVRKSTHHKQKQKGITIGSGPGSSLRAVVPPSQKQHPTPSNRHCTGLFISRLEPQCSAKQLQTYIWKQAGHRVRTEKIKTRYDTYSSFYIPCERRVREDLHDPSILSGQVVPS